MWFYHERCHDAHHGEALLDDLVSRDRREDDQAYEPLRVPAILNWLAIVSVGLCGIFTVINGLS